MLFLTMGGVGWIPGPHGSIASVIGAAILWYCQPWLGLGPFLLVILSLSVFSCAALLQCLPLTADPTEVVIDEVIGVAVALTPLFTSIEVGGWRYLFTAVLLFRVFDIIKPLGISTIDRISHPTTVILDDVMAGLYAALLTTLVFQLL